MTMNSISLTGDKQLDRMFKQLPKSLTSKVIRGALRESSKPMVKHAKSKLRTDNRKTGNLYRSIGVVNDKSRQYKGSVRVGARMKKNSKNMLGFHAHWIEFGTAPRSPKDHKTLKFESDGKIMFPKKVKGVTAQPFLRPAYKATHKKVTDEFGEIAGNRLLKDINKFIAKNGR